MEIQIPSVSIIIPVYNAEAYIKQCLDSLVEQTYPFFEIICVDDGSQDRSLEILQEYQKQDSRITVIRQNNQFAGAARNTGMEAAKGTYLLFLDADDFFCHDMLEKAVSRAQRDHTEILIFDACKFDHLSRKVMNTSWDFLLENLFGRGVKSASELSDVIYRFTTPAPWNKLFLREYIIKNELRFQSLKRVNDLFFVYAALSCADRIGILNEKLMYYRMNNSGSLQGSVCDTPAVFAKALYALQDFLKARNIWNKFEHSFYVMAASVCINNLNKMKSEKIYQQLCNIIKCEVIPRLGFEHSSLDDQLNQAVADGEDLVIYGAGAVAAAFVRYLIIHCRYETDKIKAAVTNAAGNAASICQIKVREIDTLPLCGQNRLVVIAVSEESRQKEMEDYLHSRGVKRIAKLGFCELLTLLQSIPASEKVF